MMLNAVLFRLLYCIGKAFGLVPFTYRHGHHLTISRDSLAYSILYALTVTACLPYIQFAYFDYILFHSQERYTINFVTAINLFASTLRTICGAWSVIVHRKRLLTWLEECIRLHRIIQTILPCSAMLSASQAALNLRWVIPRVTSLVAVVQVTVIIINGTLFCDSLSHKLQNWVVLVNTHGYAIVSSAVYFSAVYTIYGFYETLNRRLRELMDSIRRSDRRRDDANKGVGGGKNRGGVRPRWQAGMQMQVQCDISEEIDRLSVIYEEVTEALVQINRFYALQLLMSVVCSFNYTLTGMFYIYGDIVYMTRNAATIREFDYNELIFDITFLSFYIFELHTIVWISNVVKQEAASTGSMLFTTAVSADERLKQSIELFLLQVLNIQPEISVFGMFVIDNTLKFSIAGTITSFLTILIQFELADAQNAQTPRSMNEFKMFK